VGTLKPLSFESHLEVGSAEQCGFQFRLLAPAPMLCEMHFLMSGLSLRLPAPVGIVSGTAASVPLCVKLPAGKLCFLSQVLRGESGAVVSSAPRRRSRPAGRTSWRHLDTRLGYSGFFFAFSLFHCEMHDSNFICFKENNNNFLYLEHFVFCLYTLIQVHRKLTTKKIKKTKKNSITSI